MKNLKLKGFFAAALMAVSCFAFAQAEEAAETEAKQEKMVLTVEEAVKFALENNKTLKSSAIDLEMKKRANDNSWNVFLPKASLSLTANRTTDIDSTLQSINGSAQMMGLMKSLHPGDPIADNIPVPAIKADEEKLHWSTVGNLGLSWSFNAAMIANIKIAKTQYEAGKISYEKSCSEMEVNIRKLFYGLLLQQESLKINKDSLANAKARYDQAAINYRNGLVPELQLLNTQVTYENQKPAVLKAETSLEQSLDTFAFLLGLPYGTEIELKGNIETKFIKVDADELVKKYCETSNEILSMKKNIELANFGLKAKRLSVYTPSIAVNYSYQPVFAAMGETYSLSDASDKGSLSLTLAFSDLLSFLPWSSASQEIKNIQQQIVQAELGYEMMVQNAEVEIHKLVDNLEIAKVNLQAMQSTAELAQKAYNSTLRGFNNGTQEWLSVRESDASLKQARLGLMNERFNYISAVLDLEQKLNMKISE